MPRIIGYRGSSVIHLNLCDSLEETFGDGKWIFRKAMAPYLPREVINRSKTGFGAPLRHWLRNDLRPLVDDVLSERSLEARGIFDPEGARQLVRLNEERRIDATYTVFSMICIELWCRMFIDRATPGPL